MKRILFAATLSISLVVGLFLVPATAPLSTPPNAPSNNAATPDQSSSVSLSKENLDLSKKETSSAAEEKETQTFTDLKNLENEVQKIFNRTQFDPKKMTSKEYEIAIQILEEYHLKMKEFSEELKANKNL